MGPVPHVSVIMTAYNAAPYLRVALESVLNQTFTDFEMVVVENGSTDETRDLLNSFKSDPRLRVIELDRNIGRTPALTLALGEARGDYVANLDADDVSLPDRLARQSAYMDAHPDCILVASWCDLIDERGDWCGSFQPGEGRVNALMLSFNPIAHSAAMFRRDLALSVGGYPACYAFSQDFGLWVALAARGNAVVLSEVLAQIRTHENNMTKRPEYDLIRRRDAFTIFQAASHLKGVSPESRSAGRRIIALEKAACARIQWLLGHRKEAACYAVSAFFTAPWVIIARAFTLLSTASK